MCNHTKLTNGSLSYFGKYVKHFGKIEGMKLYGVHTKCFIKQKKFKIY